MAGRYECRRVSSFAEEIVSTRQNYSITCRVVRIGGCNNHPWYILASMDRGSQGLRKPGQQFANTPKKGRIDAPPRSTPRSPARARRGELYVCQADHDARW